jgi:hypothetical protein
LTKSNVIGIVSAYPNIQVFHRQAAFVLGVQDAGKLLNKDISVKTKYVGSWYSPPDEKSIAETLVDTYKADVLTVQTDSSAAVDVAKAKGVWFVGRTWILSESSRAAPDSSCIVLHPLGSHIRQDNPGLRGWKQDPHGDLLPGDGNFHDPG